MAFKAIFPPLAPGERPEGRFVLLGAPYDAGSSYRPGARLAPEQIRRLAESLNPAGERGTDLTGLGRDAGDVPLNNRAEQAFAAIEAAVGKVLDAGAVPVLLGGDHSVTIPAFQAALARVPELELLYLDAHPDLYPDYGGDPLSHACVVRRILELEGMEGRRVTQVGIRASTPEQAAFARAAGVRTVPAWELDGFRWEAERPVYLSLDVDVLDPAFAPGCGNPVPGGPSSRELFALLRRLAVRPVALDVVETNPLLDPHGLTALVAARAVQAFLELWGHVTGTS